MSESMTPGEDLRPRRTLTGPLRSAFLLLVVIATALPSSVANAQNVEMCINDMSNEEIDDLTEEIVGEMRRHRRHARGWRFGWLAAYTGIAVVSLGVLRPNANRDTDNGRARHLGYMGAGIAASIAAARLAWYPMPDVWGVRRIERMPNESREEKLAKLRYAFNVLERSGYWQHLLTGLTSYGIAIGWGIGWGTAISVKHDNAFSAALGFIGSPLLGITTILTAPNWAQAHYDRTRASVCLGRYVGDAEPDPMSEDYEEEEYEDEEPWDDVPDEPLEGDAPAEDTDVEPTTSPEDTTVSFYPTMGGGMLHVQF